MFIFQVGKTYRKGNNFITVASRTANTITGTHGDTYPVIRQVGYMAAEEVRYRTGETALDACTGCVWPEKPFDDTPPKSEAPNPFAGTIWEQDAPEFFAAYRRRKTVGLFGDREQFNDDNRIMAGFAALWIQCPSNFDQMRAWIGSVEAADKAETAEACELENDPFLPLDDALIDQSR